MSYPITGCGNGSDVFDRLSIEDLQNEPEQFTLFILSFLIIQRRMDSIREFLPGFPMDMNFPPPIAFSEIAGIHGLPYREYAGDKPDSDIRATYYSGKDKKDTNPTPSRFGGYCNHGSVLFPTWHRPYVLLIEQAIGEVAIAIAVRIDNMFVRDGTYIDAATRLRFPFWDWAEERVASEGLPAVLCEDTVQIMDPISKEKKSIANPLSFYPYEVGNRPEGFKREDGESFYGTPESAYFGDWTRTFRYAASSPYATESNIGQLQHQLQVQAGDLRRKVARLFSYDNDDVHSAQIWDEFSNHTTQSLRKMDYYNAGSLEGVHDSIHDILGGNGNMSYPDYAAYDPIFYLHHANVDRLFALWEWCYPDLWMQYSYKNDGSRSHVWTQSRGTYFEVYNERVSPDSDLAPFRNKDGEYWNSSQTRFLNSTAYPKYYSYPEVAGVKVDKDGATRSDREKGRQNIQKYYGYDPEEEAKYLKQTSSPLFTPPPNDIPSGYNAIDKYRNFTVVVELPEHAFNAPYSFRLTRRKMSGALGGRGAEVIGSVAVFARPDYSPCKGCAIRRDAGNMIRGIITIPPILVDDIIRSTPDLCDRIVDDKALTEGIKKALSGELFDAAGGGLATGHTGEHRPPGEAVPKHAAPGDIVLLSSAVARPIGGGPVTFFDWKNHSEIFKSGWVRPQ